MAVKFDVDLFVIGGGSGGLRAARIAAGHGATVMLAEEYRLGGTCIIRGCIPKKLFVYASRFSALFEDSSEFGWTGVQPHFDWSLLLAAKDREVARLEALYTRSQESVGVTLVKSRAVLEDEHTIRLVCDGRRIRAKTVLIATGAQPEQAVVPGCELAITSNEVFELPHFPRRLVIAGAGYIAVEFAGVFAALGSDVTVICRGDNLLRGFDTDLRQALAQAYTARGMKLIFDDNIISLARTRESGPEAESALIVSTRNELTLRADQVVMAIGRVPNSEGLGLASAGVKTDAGGAIMVDTELRTSTPNIYAVGDVTNHVGLTPVAIREGHSFADSHFGACPWTVNYSNVPTAVFSTPEIGTVGLTELEARVQFDLVHVYQTCFRSLTDRAAGKSEHTLMKLVVDGASGRILGVHLFAEGASEMIQFIAVAVRAGATIEQFSTTVAVHPTLGEELVTLHTPSAQYRRESTASGAG